MKMSVIEESMFGFITKLGNSFRSMQGWLYMLGTIIPGAMAWIASTLDGLSYSQQCIIVLAAVALGLLIANLAITGIDKIRLYFKSGAEQERIIKAINTLGQNVTELDIVTAAGIWAGTMELSDVQRHTYFRNLKNAINHNEVQATNHNPPRKANMDSKVEMGSLLNYWRKNGVIK